MHKKVENNENVLPLFCVQKKNIELIIKAFQVEQNTIIDQLIELGCDKDYNRDHASLESKISEQYYLIIAIANAIGVNESSSSTSTKNSSFHIKLTKIK